MITFKLLKSYENQDIFIKMMEESGIPFKTESARHVQLDAYMLRGAEDKDDLVVLVAPEDFLDAHRAYRSFLKPAIDKADRDHHLYDVPDEELLEIFDEQHEYDDFEVMMAQRILKERGISYSDEDLMEKLQAIWNRSMMTEKAKSGWIIGGYIFAFLGWIVPFLALAGAFIGWYYSFSTKHGLDGKKYRRFDKRSREHGSAMLFLSIIFGGISIYIRVTGYQL